MLKPGSCVTDQSPPWHAGMSVVRLALPGKVLELGAVYYEFAFCLQLFIGLKSGIIETGTEKP